MAVLDITGQQPAKQYNSNPVSLRGKRWINRTDLNRTSASNALNSSAKPSAELTEAAGGSPLIAQLLLQRGINTPEAVQHFLDLEHYQPVSGLELPDMALALPRIEAAIESQEPILIYGDFDVDGITGTSILMETLTFLGANVSYYIPDRAAEGHGLNTAACLRLVSARQVKLVITTDTGITNFNEISLLKNLGVDTIVTDHHELPENLPPSLANINPKCFADQSHPLAVLCGAGVAYKLSELLLDASNKPDATIIKRQLLDLTAIGTVADLASLLNENRYLVYEGLKVLNQRNRLGLREILENANTAPETKLTSETVGFTIGPRLNAVGRLDHAKHAVELLTTNDPDIAKQIAAKLEQLNLKRRELCDQTFLEADSFLNQSGGLGDKKAIVLASTGWNLGIIGIVASRLIEKYHVPTFMMVVDEEKGIARCSARSIPGFHLHDELVPISEMFEHFGGHAGAGGFSMQLAKLNQFKDRIYNITATKISDEQCTPIIEVDASIDWPQLNPHLIDLINQMAPFGMDNPSPRFILSDAHIGAQKALGAEAKHMKLILSPSSKDAKTASGNSIEALIWNFAGQPKFNPDEAYDFVVVPETNTFNNKTKVQLIVDDYRYTNAANQAPKLQAPASGVASTASPASIPAKPTLQSTPTNPSQPIRSPLPLAANVSAHTNSQQSDSHDLIVVIDHRSTDAIENFVGQLMLPIQDQSSTLIYHEGKAPAIPFLDTNLLSGRATLKPAETLILWDLPPTAELLYQLKKTVNPKTIHLVGGKYQSVPVHQPEKNYLNLILRWVKQELDKQDPSKQNTAQLEQSPDTLATQLGLSTPVISTGLILLNRLGLVEVRLSNQNVILALPKTEATSALDVTQLLEYTLFQQALQQQSRFRRWLLSAPIETIKTCLQTGHVDGTLFEMS